MAEDSVQGAIQKLYGAFPLTSAPVDPEHPTFDSLLGALEAVHRGTMGMNVLESYHVSLSVQLQGAKAKVAGRATEGDSIDLRISGHQMAATVLDLVQAMLESVDEYIQAPNDERMASVLNLLMQCMGYMKILESL
jgi:hypothetical protein